MAELLAQPAVLGILLASLPLVAAAWNLARELRHSSQMQRANVEAEYLKAALEVCHVPNEAIHAFAFDVSHHLHLKGESLRTVAGGLAVPAETAWNKFSGEIERFNRTLKIALAFARRGHDESLVRAIVAAHGLVQELARVLPRILDGTVTPSNLEHAPEYRAAFHATDHASDLLIDRIATIYTGSPRRWLNWGRRSHFERGVRDFSTRDFDRV